jgi:hypothetical protein
MPEKKALVFRDKDSPMMDELTLNQETWCPPDARVSAMLSTACSSPLKRP